MLLDAQFLHVAPPSPRIDTPWPWLDGAVRDALAVLSALCAPAEELPMSGSLLGHRAGIANTRFEGLIRRLIADGFVSSHRGRNGGYQLARPPAEILLIDVFSSALPGRSPQPHDGALAACLHAWLSTHSVADLIRSS